MSTTSTATTTSGGSTTTGRAAPAARAGRRARRIAGVMTALVLGLGTLGACASEGDRSDAAAPPASGVRSTSADAAGAPSKAATRSAESPGRAQQTAPVDRRLVRQATMSLEVDDVARASSDVAAVADELGGYVHSENLGSASRERTTSTWGRVTIKVPTAKHAEAMRQVAGKGTLLSRSSSVEDVTTQYVDTKARVRTMRLGIQRIQRLLAKATSLDDVIALESELTTRESELETTLAQMKSLEERTSMSSISVELTTDAALASEEEETGFVAGLKRGWSAFLWSVTAVLTLLGALLPFVVALALLVGPAVWWLRRHRRARAGSAPRVLVDEVHDPGQHVGVGARQNPVTEVEDVPGGGGALGEDRPHA